MLALIFFSYYYETLHSMPSVMADTTRFPRLCASVVFHFSPRLKHDTMTPDMARKHVDNFLDANKGSGTCAPRLRKNKLLKTRTGEYIFVTTFSKPVGGAHTRAVARVTFYVSGDAVKCDLKYRVENETAVHSGNGSVGFSTQWVDSVIKRKLKMKDGLIAGRTLTCHGGRTLRIISSTLRIKLGISLPCDCMARLAYRFCPCPHNALV